MVNFGRRSPSGVNFPRRNTLRCIGAERRLQRSLEDSSARARRRNKVPAIYLETFQIPPPLSSVIATRNRHFPCRGASQKAADGLRGRSRRSKASNFSPVEAARPARSAQVNSIPWQRVGGRASRLRRPPAVRYAEGFRTPAPCTTVGRAAGGRGSKASQGGNCGEEGRCLVERGLWGFLGRQQIACVGAQPDGAQS